MENIEEKKIEIIDELNNPFLNIIEEELENFQTCIMPFGKHKGKSLRTIYIEDYIYCIWLSKNIKEPRGDLISFINLIKKYRTF